VWHVAFGTVSHACAMKCEKCEKEGEGYENVMAFSNRTEREDMVVSQDGHTLYLLH